MYASSCIISDGSDFFSLYVHMANVYWDTCTSTKYRFFHFFHADFPMAYRYLVVVVGSCVVVGVP